MNKQILSNSLQALKDNIINHPVRFGIILSIIWALGATEIYFERLMNPTREVVGDWIIEGPSTFNIIDYFNLALLPIIIGWLIAYLIIWQRPWLMGIIERFKKLSPTVQCLIIAPIALKLIFRHIETEFIFALAYAPILIWFVSKKVVYGLFYAATKAISDAKINVSDKNGDAK